MDKYIVFHGVIEPFVLFSPAHLASLAVVAATCAALVIFGRNMAGEDRTRLFRRLFAGFIFFQELSLHIYEIKAGTWSIAYSLPLHLCGISVVLAIVLLLTENRTIYELTYFWGFGGAVQALLTPDLGPFGFPHFVFYQFFVSHGSIIAACAYMTFARGFKPTHRSVWTTFALTNLYAAPIAFINNLAGANYLFICQKPENASLIDFLGPWPWYVLSLEFVAIIMFYLLYLPFYLSGINRTGTIESGRFNF